MSTTRELARKFVEWADGEGHEKLAEAMAQSDRHRHCQEPERCARVELQDHLATIQELGVCISANRIRALLSYAEKCEGAPLLPQSAISRLYSPRALNEELPTAAN